jgi:hypothetical protein
MGKLYGQICLDLKGFGGLLMRCKSAVFWQTERILGIFSTRNEMKQFTGFSLEQKKIERKSEPI